MRQQLYVALTQNLEAAKIDEARNTPVITEVESPEGFVQRMPRHTVRNSVLGLLAGVASAIGIAFFIEYVARQREDEAEDYQEFLALKKQTLRPIRRLVRCYALNGTGVCGVLLAALAPHLRMTAGSQMLAEGKTASEAWRHSVQYVQGSWCFADD
jgi:hypothetical protein